MTSFPCLVWSWDPALGQSVWRISLQPSHPLSPMLMLKFAPQCALWPAGGAVIALQTSAVTLGTESCTYTVINETTGRGNEWKSLIKVFTVFKCFWVERTSLRPDYSCGRASPLRNPVSVGQTHLQPWYSHYLKLLNNTANKDCFHYSQIISQ